MSKNIETLLADLREKKMQFVEVIAHIEKNYLHTPTAFKNGQVENDATQNQGSAKVLAFASLNKLSKEDTLLLFAEHYQAVLDAPEAQDHQNIRQFMSQGWEGITFEGEALRAK